MQLRQSVAPHFRRRDSVKDISLVLIIACGVLLVPAVMTYGLRAVVMALSGMLGAVLVEGAWRFFSNQEQTLNDLTAVATGLICAMLIPAECSIWVPFFAAAFAVGVVKLPFGSVGRSAFNPSAVGGCFALLCCGVFRENYTGSRKTVLYECLAGKCYGYSRGILPAFGSVDTFSGSIADSVSPLVLLAAGEQNTVSSSDAVAAVCDPGLTAGDFLLSNWNGTMGTAAILLVILCGVFLALLGTCAWQGAVSFAVSVAAFSLIFPYRSIPVWQSPLYDLFTGTTLFTAVFIVGDIMTAPNMNTGRVMYGICGGALTILLRRLGAVESCELFAAAMIAPLSYAIDQMVWRFRQRGISLHAQRKKLSRKLRKLLHINPGPFDSFDFDDEENDDGNEI